MKKYFKILMIIIVLLTNHTGNMGHCQCSFTYKNSTLLDEVAYDGVETSDGGFIIATGSGTNAPELFNSFLIKINCNGDTTSTKSIIKNNMNCIIVDLIKSDDGNIYGVGLVKSSQETRLWVLKMNSNMDILLDTSYNIGLIYIYYTFGFIDHHEDLVIYGSAGNDLGQLHPYIYRVSQTGDSLLYRYYPASGSQHVYSMIEKPDTSGYYMMIWGQYQVVTPSPGQILTFNESFDITSIDSLPKDLNMYYNAKVFNDHEFILTGKVDVWNDSRRTDLLGIKKLDTSFSWQQSNYLGPPDTINYPGYYHNLDFIDTSNIYYGGTCNQAIASFSSNQSYFLLGKFDSELNLQWQKYYGGDQYYSLWGITATSDGGCLLYGSSFDYLTQNMERDVFIVKTDSAGVLTGTDGEAVPLLHDAIVYPNPGTDDLIVESGPQVSGAILFMYDLHGALVLKSAIISPKIKIDTKLWDSGTYIWQVVYKDQVVDKGKWIKL